MHVALAGGRGRDDDHLYGTPRTTNLFSHHSAEAQRPRKLRMITTLKTHATSQSHPRSQCRGAWPPRPWRPRCRPPACITKTTNGISECFVSGREQSALSCPACCPHSHLQVGGDETTTTFMTHFMGRQGPPIYSHPIQRKRNVPESSERFGVIMCMCRT
jgi:hypothetical protein